MPDELDAIGDREERDEAKREKARGDTPYEPPAGVAGNCDVCNRWSGRLIDGACAPCRDKFGLR